VILVAQKDRRRWRECAGGVACLAYPHHVGEKRELRREKGEIVSESWYCRLL
jgi:hypothetical protein